MAQADLAGAALLGLPFAVFAVLGLVVIYKTYTARQAGASLRGMPTTAVADLAPGDGLVKVTGTAHATSDDLVSGSLLTARGVARKTRIWSNLEHQRHDWVDDETAVPFLVDDSTGEVPVDFPEAGTVDADTDLVLAGGSQPDAFVVSNLPESELDRSIWESPFVYAVGAILYLFGVAPLLFVLAGAL